MQNAPSLIYDPHHLSSQLQVAPRYINHDIPLVLRQSENLDVLPRLAAHEVLDDPSEHVAPHAVSLGIIQGCACLEIVRCPAEVTAQAGSSFGLFGGREEDGLIHRNLAALAVHLEGVQLGVKFADADCPSGVGPLVDQLLLIRLQQNYVAVLVWQVSDLGPSDLPCPLPSSRQTAPDTLCV